MKRKLLTAVLACFAAFVITGNSAAAAKTEKAVIRTAIYCDHCAVCETCGKLFQSEMLKITGVKMYELDDKKMTITVFYNPRKTDLQSIKTGISKLGYDADEVKADPAAYDRLDGCCKKN